MHSLDQHSAGKCFQRSTAPQQMRSLSQCAVMHQAYLSLYSQTSKTADLNFLPCTAPAALPVQHCRHSSTKPAHR